MIQAVAKVMEPTERAGRFDPTRSLYLETLILVERLHRRLLEVIKDEFDRRGRADINSVQALLLYNIGEKDLTAGELRTRGYYLGSNVSYNVKKMVENGYLAQERSPHDRRAVHVKLSEKSLKIVERMHEMYDRHLKTMTAEVASEGDLDGINVTLRKLERFWATSMDYR
jgi:DNA-binding MarR family transcriptional regulator